MKTPEKLKADEFFMIVQSFLVSNYSAGGELTSYNQHVSAHPLSEFLVFFFHHQSTPRVEEPTTLCHHYLANGTHPHFPIKFSTARISKMYVAAPPMTYSVWYHRNGNSFSSMKSGFTSDTPDITPPGMCDQSARLNP